MIRYDRGYSRRRFLESALGAATAGVLLPLWDAIAQQGDITRAYPEELLSLDAYTRGKISAGQEITADNVEHVRDLLDPVKYHQISKMGRRLRVAPTTTELHQLSPWEYVEATIRNRGQARFDAAGNVVAADGRPWIGGNPFPDSMGALELFAGLTLSWGRHDSCLYAVREYDLDREGRIRFDYQLGWAELSPVARVQSDPKPYWEEHMDKLRFQSVFYTGPESVRGTSYLNIWPYDQSKFPDLFGYLPAFKRVRRFPTSQRFEPLIPGSTLYLSDAWAAGDPLHTWGNYRVVGRGPMLAAVSRGWNPQHPNWEHPTHGGPQGKTFFDTTVELVPEAIIVEAEPVQFPRAPVSKKRVWFDARTQLPIGMVSFDRRGEPYRSFDGSYAIYSSAEQAFMDGAHPYWSWTHVHAFDIQTERMSRLEQVRSIPGSHSTTVNDSSLYERYLTTAALSRLGGG